MKEKCPIDIDDLVCIELEIDDELEFDDELGDADYVSDYVNILNPPKKTWVQQTPGKVTIGAIETGTRSMGILVFIFFGIPVIFMGVMSILSGSPVDVGDFIVDGEGFSLFGIIFGLLLVALGCGFGFFGLVMALGTKIEIVIGKESYVQQGLVLKTKRTKKGATKEFFDWASVVKIGGGAIKTGSKREPYLFIRTKEKTIINAKGKNTNRIEFGINLSKKQRDFILGVLNDLHKNKRVI